VTKCRPGVICQGCRVRNKVDYMRILNAEIAVPVNVASCLRGRFTYGPVFVADVRRTDRGEYLCQHCRGVL